MAAIRAVRPHGPYRSRRALQWRGSSPSRSARRLVAEGDKVDALVIIDASARNARYRLVSRLARVLAWIGQLDGQAERQALPEPAGSTDGSRLGAGGMASPARRLCRRPPSARISDLVAGATGWQEGERVAAFRLVARAHVPGRYAGAVALARPRAATQPPARSVVVSGRRSRSRSTRSPGRISTSITEHGPELAERLRACLAGLSAWPLAP